MKSRTNFYKNIIVAAVTFVALAIASITPVYAKTSANNESGQVSTGWEKADGAWNYFDENGNRAAGWTNIAGNIYYFSEDGKMFTGTKKIDGLIYRFLPSGKLIAEIQRDNVTTVNKTTNNVLCGYVYRPYASNGKTIIICHGLGGNALQAEEIAAYLAENGYTAFAFDFAGGGADVYSDGYMTKMSVLTEINDLNYIYEFVKSRPYVDSNNIYLAGHSQGALVTGLYAAENQNEIKGLIFYAPGFVVSNEWAPRRPEDIPSGNIYMWDGMYIGPKYFEDLWELLQGREERIYELMSAYSGPVLIIQGTGDMITSPRYAETMNDYYENSVLIEYDQADHVFTGDANHQRILEDTLWFLTNN